MKPAAFDYVRPASLAEAVGLLGAGGGSAVVVAGGQSLLPILGMRLTRVGCLVDVSRLEELRGCTETSSHVCIGAGVTHAMIEDGAVPDPGLGVMRRVAARIAYRGVRTRGTIGGSVALADPAADWPACLMALRACAVVAGPGGVRRQLVGELVQGTYLTSLASDEIITGFEIPRLAADARVGIAKSVRKSGAFAMSFAVTVLEGAAGGARVALAGAGACARVLPRVGALLAGGGEAVEAALDADLGELLAAGDDEGMRLHRAGVLRSIGEARGR